MNKKNMIVSTAALAMIFVAELSQAAFVSDDFEAGNLDNWTIGGRQLGAHTANVVTCDTGSLCGHLYQSGSFTEININQYTAFDPGENITFDMKVAVSSTPPPAPNYFGYSGARIIFLDADDISLGQVVYLASTTNYPTTNLASPTTSINVIAENTWHNFDLEVLNLLSQITIDQSQIATTQVQFNTYSSTWPSPTVTVELWVDNFNTPAVPVPASVWLLGSGLIGLIGVGRRVA